MINNENSGPLITIFVIHDKLEFKALCFHSNAIYTRIWYNFLNITRIYIYRKLTLILIESSLYIATNNNQVSFDQTRYRINFLPFGRIFSAVFLGCIQIPRQNVNIFRSYETWRFNLKPVMYIFFYIYSFIIW